MIGEKSRYYRFDNVPTTNLLNPEQDYLIEEIPPPGAKQTGVQITRLIHGAYAADASGNAQQNGLAIAFQTSASDSTEVGFSAGPDGPTGAVAAFTLANGTLNDLTSQGVLVGQYVLHPGVGIVPSPPIESLSSDLLHDTLTDTAYTDYGLQASLTPGGYAVTDNLGEIGYLYNHFGTQTLSNSNAAGLQLALWALLYNTDGALSNTGDAFYVTPPGASSPTDATAYAAVQNDLTLAQGKDERAYFLNDNNPPDTPTSSTYPEGMLATETFNFVNAWNSSLSGVVFQDTNGDGTQEWGEPGIGAATVTLTGTDMDGDPVSETTVAQLDGSYTFSGLTPGTYTLTDTLPPAYTNASATAGTLGGTAAAGSISQIVIPRGDSGMNYDFAASLTPPPPPPPPLANSSPYFTSTAPTGATVNTLYSYDPTVTDSDGDPALDIALVSGPAGLSYDPTTGLVTWTPTPGQAGSQPTSFTLVVSDGHGNSDTQTCPVLVQAPANDQPPTIVSDPVTTVVAGATYEYDVQGYDPDGDALTYSVLPGAPSGLAFVPGTNRLTWATTYSSSTNYPLSYPVTVRVTDANGGTYDQAFQINVIGLNAISGRVTGVFAPDVQSQAGPCAPLTAGVISLQAIDPAVQTASAVHYYTPDNALLASGGFANGDNVAELAADGTVQPFSTLTGLTDEIQFAVANADNIGGFTNGDVFVGDNPSANNSNAEIVRISGDGQNVTEPWATLAGETGNLRGGLAFDSTGLFGGDLIAVTNTGDVWEINSSGTATQLASLSEVALNDPNVPAPNLVEGVTVVPDDPGRFGQLAGTILVADELGSDVYTIDPEGNIACYNLGKLGIEAIDIVGPNENFYGTDQTGTIIGAPAAEFSQLDGDLLLASEYPTDASGLYELCWDSNTNQPMTQPVVLATDSYAVSSWEGISFSPAGVGPIKSTLQVLPNWTVNLFTDNNGTAGNLVATTTTDNNGDYLFTGVADGDYIVQEAAVAGWTEREPAGAGYSQSFASGSQPQAVTLPDFQNSQDDPYGPNDDPAFDSKPNQSANVGERYRYAVDAQDPDHDVITYSLAAGPKGMAINAQTGVVYWTPTTDQAGTAHVVLRADDGRGGVAVQTFDVTVSAANLGPAFTTAPPKWMPQGETNVYAAHAIDADSDTVSYSLLGAPSDVNLNSSTGVITLAQAAVLGTQYQFTIVASDGKGLSATQAVDFTVTVAPTDKPKITSTPVTTARAGHGYVYQVVATDPEDPNGLTYAFPNGDTPPTGMTIDGHTGLITWDPGPVDPNHNTFSLSVIATNSGGISSDPQNFTIEVDSQAPPSVPVIDSSPIEHAAYGMSYSYDATGHSPTGLPLAWSLDAAPLGMIIDPNTGAVRWTPTQDQIGTQNVTVRLTDLYGDFVTQGYSIVVAPAYVAPQITSQPPETAVVGSTYQYPVQVKATEGDPLTYALLAPNPLPAGLSVDPDTSLITWTDPQTVAVYTVSVQVTDEEGGSDTQTYNLNVQPVGGNSAPTITNPSFNPNLTANTAFSYQFSATDADGDPVTFSLINQVPDGVNITADGHLTWTPTENQIGQTTVWVMAEDPYGNLDTLSFAPLVHDDDQPKVATAGYNEPTVQAGSTFTYQVVLAPDTTDGDSDPVTWGVALEDQGGNALPTPPGLTIDANGKVTWHTTTADAGKPTIVVTATDAAGDNSVASFPITIDADTTTPSPTIQSSEGTQLLQGSRVTFQVTDPAETEGLKSIQLSVNGTLVPVDDHGAAWVTVPSTTGSINVVATVTDNAGNTGTTTDPFTVVAPTVPTDLNASFATGTDQEVLNIPTAISGTVGGSGFSNYTLTYTPLNGGQPATIGSGNTAVTGNALGTFDPTLLPAGPYLLTLTAYDTSGASVTAQATVNASGKAKVGDFQFSVNDLTVPSPGIPITITRTDDAAYAGQNDGDFGNGWSLAETDLHLTVSVPNAPFSGLLSPFKDGTRVTITRPGAAPEGFTFYGVPAVGGYGLATDAEYHPEFVPDPGVTDTLTVSDVALYKLDDGTYFVSSDANMDPYNPADSVFGTGTYTLSEHDGLTRVINAMISDNYTSRPRQLHFPPRRA